MFKLVQTGNSLPFSFLLDPTAEFEAGQVAQLRLNGSQIVCGVSDGRWPIGIIDDMRSKSFSAPAIDEIVITNLIAGVYDSNHDLVTPMDVKVELENPNVYASSFVSDPVDVALNPRNGVVTFLAGTKLNFDLDGDGIPDSIRTRVSYTYQVPNVPGDDSTLGSGRITVWFDRMIFETDMYETSVRYPLNGLLYSNESGKLTTRVIAENYPPIAIIVAPPTAMFSGLQALLL